MKPKVVHLRLEIECSGDVRVAHVREALKELLDNNGVCRRIVQNGPDKTCDFTVNWPNTKIKQGKARIIRWRT